MTIQDEIFMKRAIELSRSAVRRGNEPFGAVLVKGGEIVFESENRIYTEHDPTYHAETGLIRDFCARTGIADLKEYTLYSSCGAGNADLEHILGNEGNGCCETVFENSFWRPRVTSGILREESIKVLEEYFSDHKKG